MERVPELKVSILEARSMKGEAARVEGDCMRVSGGERGISGRSSRNLDWVRAGVPDLARGFRMRPGGGVCRAKDSREVLENSEGVTRPESRLAVVPLRRKIEVQLPTMRPLWSEPRRTSDCGSGGSGFSGSGVLRYARSLSVDKCEGPGERFCRTGEVGGDRPAADNRTAFAVSMTASSFSSGVGSSR